MSSFIGELAVLRVTHLELVQHDVIRLACELEELGQKKELVGLQAFWAASPADAPPA